MVENIDNADKYFMVKLYILQRLSLMLQIKEPIVFPK